MEASSAIHTLRQELEELRRSIGQSVRTHEVVVTDPNGRARVALHAKAESGTVAAYSWRGDRLACATEVFAMDSGHGESAYSGLALIDHGDVVGALELLEGEQPSLWFGDEQAH